jgi:hypothetical protein
MDGVAIIWSILKTDTDVLALVPAARISAGVLAEGTTLDAISITKVSSMDRNIIHPLAKRRVNERVQVTVLAATYPRAKAIIRAVRGAAADFIGSAASMTEVTIHTDVGGPDFMDDKASIYMTSQDFIVGFNESR